MRIKKMVLPDGAYKIIDQLQKNGFEAFVVGGCVRDSVMDRIPDDWDITTSASPQMTKRLFDRTFDTGIKHGTVTVLIENETYEVTTYRIEGEYEDHRRPSGVVFTDNIAEDLKRRDFTMNAIAYHPEQGFVDPFGGLKDIEEQVIRCVGIPEERFNEDALRILRAVRFSGQLDFEIEDGTMEGMKKCGGYLAQISPERIRVELNKLLLSDHPEKILLMDEVGILEYVLPELQTCLTTEQNHPYHIYNVGKHMIKAVGHVKKNIVLRWAALLHDIGKPVCRTTDEKGIDHFYNHGEMSERMAMQILKRLRFDNKGTDKILRLVKWHDRPIELTNRAVKKAINAIGDDIFLELLELKTADVRAQNPEYAPKRLKQLENIKEIYESIREKNECMSVKELVIDGHDLIKMGMKPGRQIGEILDQLLELVIENPQVNQKEYLLDLASKAYENRNA